MLLFAWRLELSQICHSSGREVSACSSQLSEGNALGNLARVEGDVVVLPVTSQWDSEALSLKGLHIGTA